MTQGNVLRSEIPVGSFEDVRKVFSCLDVGFVESLFFGADHVYVMAAFDLPDISEDSVFTDFPGAAIQALAVWSRCIVRWKELDSTSNCGDPSACHVVHIEVHLLSSDF